MVRENLRATASSGSAGPCSCMRRRLADRSDAARHRDHHGRAAARMAALRRDCCCSCRWCARWGDTVAVRVRVRVGVSVSVRHGEGQLDGHCGRMADRSK